MVAVDVIETGVIETCGNWFGPLTRNDFFRCEEAGDGANIFAQRSPVGISAAQRPFQRSSGFVNDAAAGYGRLLERVQRTRGVTEAVKRVRL